MHDIGVQVVLIEGYTIHRHVYFLKVHRERVNVMSTHHVS